MTYPSGEANVMTVLRTIAGWTKDNTSHGDHLVLSSGKSNKYAILSSLEHESEPMSIGQATAVSHWMTRVEVFQPINRFGVDLTTLYGLVDDIIRQFEKYPNLGNGAGAAIHGAYPMRGEAPVEVTMDMGGTSRAFYKMDVVIRWNEERSVTLASTP